MKSLRIKGIKLLIDVNEWLFFERKLKKFYASEGNLTTVVDVGANKGQSIRFFLALNPSCIIHAFEPNPELFQLLQEKYASNPNIHLYNLGVSDVTGQKLFFQNVLDYTSSFEALNPDSEYLAKKASMLGVKKEALVEKEYLVETVTLSEFFKRHPEIVSVDVLKIDTEGHELSCLRGLFGGQFPAVRTIQLEHHQDDMYLHASGIAELDAILQANGYSEHKRFRHGFGNFYEVLYKRPA